jgi:dTDP-4-amino-4,6-dideoxygalactose transaminase
MKDSITFDESSAADRDIDEPTRVGSFYPWPIADEDVREALARAYADGSWGRYHGPHCEGLCRELGAMLAVEHVTLCSSGTIAVELALRGLKVAPGSEVILAAYDFAGNFRAIEAVGARPVLVDINPRTWCLDPATLAGAVGTQTKAIIVSHLHGGIADMPQIMAFAETHGLAIVEDACQAPGAMVEGRRAGTWGDAGVLSFGGSKLLTAGRGGAILTRRADVQQRIKVFVHRGNDAFPLSELQAAVLLPQLARLDERNRKRQNSNHPTVEPSFYKFAWLVDVGNAPPRLSRDALVAAAQSQRVPLDVGFRGFARRSARRCRTVGDLRHGVAAAEKTVLLHHPVLLSGEVELAQMIDRLDDVLRNVCGPDEP